MANFDFAIKPIGTKKDKKLSRKELTLDMGTPTEYAKSTPATGVGLVGLDTPISLIKASQEQRQRQGYLTATPMPLTTTIPEGIKKRGEQAKEKSIIKEEYKIKDPERYSKLTTVGMLTAKMSSKGAGELWDKVGATEEERYAFAGYDIVVPIGGINFVSSQQAQTIIAKTVKSTITRKDLIDITAGRVKSGVKYDVYKTMVGNESMRKEITAIAKNKAIPLKQKISDYIKNLFKTKEITIKGKSLAPAEKNAIITGKELIAPKIVPIPQPIIKPIPKPIPEPQKGLSKQVIPEKGVIQHTEEVAQILRESKGVSADDIMVKHPDINLKRDVHVTDIHGNKSIIPEGEALTPYELKGNKVLLQDGETYIVSKSQAQNVMQNAEKGEAKPFAKELKETEETIKGFSGNKIDDIAQEMFGKQFRQLSRDEAPNVRAELEKRGGAGADTTKYSQYTLPGGKNYKEILIKAPTSKDAKISYNLEEYDKFPPEVTKVFDKAGEDGEAIVKGLEKLGYTVEYQPGSFDISGFYKSTKKAPIFKSAHWDDPNVISHIRLNERTYEGKDVTFLEELQSDWAKEGREKGFIKSDEVKFDEYSESLKKKYNTTNPTLNATPEETTKWNNLLIGETGVPNNLLLKNWQELSLKRALQEAVKNKSAYFAWINGEQTSARYNLATYVENVEWYKAYPGLPNDTTKAIDITPKDSSDNLGTILIDKNGVIFKPKQSRFTPVNNEWNGKKLNEVLGKGLADKIMADEKGKLSGEGLKFGGEWAINLYDKQVPNIVKDITGVEIIKMDMGLPVDSSKRKEFIRSLSKNDPKGSFVKYEILTLKNITMSQKIMVIQINI